ncbi:MAG: nicotinamide mononucleotide transporter [Candidatus Pacebacteria bacterium]|nr:nicotinamide mononucleotide transporter [Candidatus Paceibacterota bacterium]MBP9840230.1 nicotinamide mononucleotide transporter [Candidatus Paceibacterota bacterium]
MNNATAVIKLLGPLRGVMEQAYVALAMLLVTVAYELGSSYLVPGSSFNWWEFIGTWAGLVCVWLSRTENVLCWPWGIVSAAAFGMFFWQIGLPGQQWLNWGYFLVIQLWAWPHWVFGGRMRTELPVTRLSLKGRLTALAALVAGTLTVYFAIDALVPGSLYPALDATVVASSIVAQFLLGRKKIESWILWLGPVNLLSITLFFAAGAYTVMALYVAFFIHACFALRTWSKTRAENTHV